MIEKPIIIIIFMYATSFGILGAQYAIADVFGLTLTNWEGTEIKPSLLAIIAQDTLNLLTTNVTSTNQTTIQTDPITAAAEITLQLFLILTGTYVFNFIYLMGVPAIIVSGFALLYLILLARTMIAYLRGV